MTTLRITGTITGMRIWESLNHEMLHFEKDGIETSLRLPLNTLKGSDALIGDDVVIQVTIASPAEEIDIDNLLEEAIR